MSTGNGSTESEACRMLNIIESAFGSNSPQYSDARDLVKQTRMGADTDPHLAARVLSHVTLAERGPADAAAELGRRLGEAAATVSDAAAAKDARAVTDSLRKLRDALHGVAYDAARLYRLSLRSEMDLPDSREPEQDRCANCPCTEQYHESDGFDDDGGGCDPADRKCVNECGCHGWEPLKPEAGK